MTAPGVRLMKMFMAHIPASEFDYLEEVIKSYDTPYVIALETEPYDHYHFMAELSHVEYHRFCKNIFKDKYRLRGRAGRKGTPDEGKPKQYGIVRSDIENIDLAMAYTLKDGLYRTNMDPEYIKSCIEQSYKKTDKNLETEKLFKHLDTIEFKDEKYQYFEYGYQKTNYDTITMKILENIYEYIITTDNKLSLSRTAINNYFLNYLRKTQNINISTKIKLCRLFNNH